VLSPPPSDRLHEGAGLVLDNARAWVADALLLARHQGHLGHSLGLMLLALEESAKAFMWVMAPTLADPNERGNILAMSISDHAGRLLIGRALVIAYRSRQPRPTAAVPPSDQGPRGLLEYLQSPLRGVPAPSARA